MTGIGGLLIAAAAGYWVLTLATKEKNQVKKLGQLVGTIILAVSLGAVGLSVYCWATRCPTSGKWGYSSGKMACPMPMSEKS